MNDKELEAIVLSTVADSFYFVGRFDEAALSASRAAGMATDKAIKATACKQLARACLAKKEGKAAVEKASEAVALAKESGKKEVQAAALQVLADAQILQRDGDGAMKS